MSDPEGVGNERYGNQIQKILLGSNLRQDCPIFKIRKRSVKPQLSKFSNKGQPD